MYITALTATNLNPKYLSCAIHFVQFWLAQGSSEKNRYTPLVIVVAQDLPDELISIRNYCVLFNPPIGLSDVFTSQFVRSLYAPLVKSDLVLTTDVDMFPLSLKVFKHVLQSSPEPLSTFHICRDVLPEGQYAICYNIAAPDVWSEVTGVRSIDDVSKVLQREFEDARERNSGYSEDHGAAGWYSDQEFLYRIVELFEQKSKGKVLRFKDHATRHSRLDRASAPFPIKWFFLLRVVFSTLTDYHVHHPIEDNKRYILAVYSAVRINRFFRFLRPSKHS
jgi:hypothetical protein